jgi:hypothetical protein
MTRLSTDPFESGRAGVDVNEVLEGLVGLAGLRMMIDKPSTCSSEKVSRVELESSEGGKSGWGGCCSGAKSGTVAESGV